MAKRVQSHAARFSLGVARGRRANPARTPDSRYWRVNINPLERYVLSAPDSVQYRLWPDGSGIDNLYLAGDWVRSGVNGGCIQAAVIAGRMVARAITESDMFINGDGSNSGDFSIPITALPLFSLADKFKSAAAGGLGAVDAYCATIAVTVAYAQSKLPAGLRLVPLRIGINGIRSF